MDTSLTDGLIAGYWLICNVLLVRTAFRVTDFVFPGQMDAARIQNALVLYLASVTAAVLLVGGTGLLSRPALLGIGGFMAGLGAVGCRFLGSPSGKLANANSTSTRWKWIGLLGAGLFFGHVLVHGLLRLPTDFDCLMYHLPLIDSWLQSGSLYAPDCANWFLAAGNEALGLWIVGPFSGDFLIGLNNVPIVILLTVSMYELSRQLGLKNCWPLLATVASLLLHTLWHESDDASNDLPVAAYFMAGCCYAIHYLTNRRWEKLVLCGLCIGLLAGVKYFALGYATVLIVGLSVVMWLLNGVLSSMRVFLILVLIGSMLGGYWYLRNWLIRGSPLFPIGVETTTEAMAYPNIWRTTFLGNGHPRVLEYGVSAVWRMSGPWHVLAVVFAPLLSGYVLVTAVTRTGRDLAVPRLASFLWFVGSLAVLLVTPYALEDQPGTLNHLHWAYTPVRYGMCFLSLASIFLGLLLSDCAQYVVQFGWLGCLVRRVLIAVAGLAISWQLFQRVTNSIEFDHLISVIIGVDIALLLAAAVWSKRKWGLPAIQFLTVYGIVFFILAGGILSARWHATWGSHFDREFQTAIFSRLDSESVSKKICVLGLRSYPFFGSRRQHDVLNPRYVPPVLDRFTIQRDISLVATHESSRPIDRYRGATADLESHPGRFQPLITGGYWHIYTVHPTRQTDRTAWKTTLRAWARE